MNYWLWNASERQPVAPLPRSFAVTPPNKAGQIGTGLGCPLATSCGVNLANGRGQDARVLEREEFRSMMMKEPSRELASDLRAGK